MLRANADAHADAQELAIQVMEETRVVGVQLAQAKSMFTELVVEMNIKYIKRQKFHSVLICKIYDNIKSNHIINDKQQHEAFIICNFFFQMRWKCYICDCNSCIFDCKHIN